ncbi:hypothetical protein Tco_0921022 [Tanacetum coccineum]
MSKNKNCICNVFSRGRVAALSASLCSSNVDEDTASRLWLQLQQNYHCIAISQSALAISCKPVQHFIQKQSILGHSGKTNVFTAEKISVLSCYFPVRYSNHIGEEISCHLWYDQLKDTRGNVLTED